MTTTYHFSGITKPEIIKLVIEDREHIHLASSLTGNKLTDVSEKFYDSDVEKQKCLKLTDEEYFSYILISFGKQGYKFISKQER